MSGRNYKIVEETDPVSSIPTSQKIGWLLLAILVGYVLVEIRDIVFNFVFAFIIAYIFNPAIVWMRNKGIKRELAVCILSIVVVIAFTLISIFFIPKVFSELRSFIHLFPERLESSYNWIKSWLESTFAFVIPASVESAVGQLKTTLFESLDVKMLKPASKALQVSVGGAVDLLLYILNLLLIPLIAVVLLYDFDDYVGAVRKFIPPRLHTRIDKRLDQVVDIFGNFFRGQLVVASILIVLYSTGYTWVGVPMSVAVGTISGIGQFVPYIGPAIGFLIGLFLILTDIPTWGTIFQFIAVYAAIQFVEGWFLTPRIVGKKLGLSFIVSIFSLIIFGRLLGFLGVLLAIPLTAILQIFGKDLVEIYKQSDFYKNHSSPRNKDNSAST